MSKKNSKKIDESPIPEDDGKVLERVNWYNQFEFFCRRKERLEEIIERMNMLRNEIYHMKERQKSGKSEILTLSLQRISSTAGKTTIKQPRDKEIKSTEMQKKREIVKKELIEEILKNEKEIERLVIENCGVDVVAKSSDIPNDNGRHTCTQPSNVTLEDKGRYKKGKRLYYLHFISSADTTLQGVQKCNVSIQGVNKGSHIKKAGNKRSK